MVKWLRELLDFVAPELCHGCLSESFQNTSYQPFCDDCVRKMKSGHRLSCLRCGADVGDGNKVSHGCAACRNERFSFSGTWKYGPYDGLIKELVLKCKLPKGEVLAEAVGWLMAQELRFCLTPNRPDAIVPIPSHWTKSIFRGHNPSHGMALGLARSLKIPCQPSWLRKVRSTPSQTSLAPNKRRTMPRDAFRAFIPGPNRNGIIWLVDDVLTTGTTATVCAEALLGQGAKEVVAIVLARGG